jgi:flavodoxin
LAKGHVLASGALVSLGLPMRSERGSSARARNFRTTKAAVIRPLIIAAAVCLVCDHARGQQRSGNAQPPRDRKILIVYLSRTNNTKAIAEITHQEIGGVLVALELERPYPDDYNAIVQQVVRENETGYRPPLKTKIDRFEQYGVVFLGFPTWGMQLPPPVRSFLHQYNLQGKTVIPFSTNAGFGVGTSFQTVRELCRQCTVLEGFVTRGGAERDGQYLMIEGARAEEARMSVRNWLRKVNESIDLRRQR